MSWVHIDYDFKLWVELPGGNDWEDTSWDNEKDWGESAADVLLAFNEMPESRRTVRRLSKVLISHRQVFVESALAHESYLYFADPGDRPLSIHVSYGPAEGEREATLRKHVRAESPDTLRPPQTEEFLSEDLGSGLRSLNHVLLEDQTIVANLWYAFRDEKHAVDIVVFASTGELGRLVAAEADFDEFVQGIHILDEDEEQDGPTEKGG